MTEINVNIDDYLTEEDKREIAVQEFRRAVAARIGRHESFREGSGVETLLANVGYHEMFRAVDEVIADPAVDARAVVESQVVAHIREIKASDVFRQKSKFWDASVGQEVIDCAVRASRAAINDRVRELIAEVDLETVRAVVHEQIDELLRGVSDERVH